MPEMVFPFLLERFNRLERDVDVAGGFSNRIIEDLHDIAALSDNFGLKE